MTKEPNNDFRNYRPVIHWHDLHWFKIIICVEREINAEHNQHNCDPPLLGWLEKTALPGDQDWTKIMVDHYIYFRWSAKVFYILSVGVQWNWHKFPAVVRQNGCSGEVIPFNWRAVYLSFLHTNMTKIVEILPHVRQCHYNDVIMGVIASQITSLTVVYSIVYSDADRRKHQQVPHHWPLCREIHRGPVKSPHKWPVTRKMFPFDFIMICHDIDLFKLGLLGHRTLRVNISKSTNNRRQHFITICISSLMR